MKILIPYRPSTGCMSTEHGLLIQEEDFRWKDTKGQYFGRRQEQDLIRGLTALNKYSVHKHDIIVCIDSDMVPLPNWLSEYENVSIFKSTFVVPEGVQDLYTATFLRYSNTVKESIMAQDDDELICYGYICDIICSPGWDHEIYEAYKKWGNKAVYAPMWVEPRCPSNKNYNVTGQNVWNRISGWRKDVCHCLIFPLKPEEDNEKIIKESEYLDWIKKATANKSFADFYVEQCGLRALGYFTGICGHAKFLKEKIQTIEMGSGWDLVFESILGTKIVLTKSFYFHVHHRFEFDL